SADEMEGNTTNYNNGISMGVPAIFIADIGWLSRPAHGVWQEREGALISNSGSTPDAMDPGAYSNIGYLLQSPDSFKELVSAAKLWSDARPPGPAHDHTVVPTMPEYHEGHTLNMRYFYGWGWSFVNAAARALVKSPALPPSVADYLEPPLPAVRHMEKHYCCFHMDLCKT